MKRRGENHPGSFELLLDTMCNTFGAVMFIAMMVVIVSALAEARRPVAADAGTAEVRIRQAESAWRRNRTLSPAAARAGQAVRQLRFGKPDRTRLAPFWLIIERGTIYRAGDNRAVAAGDAAQVAVQRIVAPDGEEYWRLTPQVGRRLEPESLPEVMRAVLDGVDPRRFFIGVLVADTDIEAYVAVREWLRGHGYSMSWTPVGGGGYRLTAGTGDYEASR